MLENLTKKSQFFKRMRVELKHLRHIKYVMIARVVKKIFDFFLTVCKYCDVFSTTRVYLLEFITIYCNLYYSLLN